MPANTSPLFSLTPNVGTTAATAANTSSAGGGTVATDIFKAFTAGANGSWVSRIRFHAVATTPTTTTATVARVFVSTVGSSTTAATNTFLVAEVNLPATAADSATVATNPVDVPLNIAVPSGSFIHITNHAAPAANSQWDVTVYGGDY